MLRGGVVPRRAEHGAVDPVGFPILERVGREVDDSVEGSIVAKVARVAGWIPGVRAVGCFRQPLAHEQDGLGKDLRDLGLYRLGLDRNKRFRLGGNLRLSVFQKVCRDRPRQGRCWNGDRRLCSRGGLRFS